MYNFFLFNVCTAIFTILNEAKQTFNYYSATNFVEKK